MAGLRYPPPYYSWDSPPSLPAWESWETGRDQRAVKSMWLPATGLGSTNSDTNFWVNAASGEFTISHSRNSCIWKYVIHTWFKTWINRYLMNSPVWDEQGSQHSVHLAPSCRAGSHNIAAASRPPLLSSHRLSSHCRYPFQLAQLLHKRRPRALATFHIAPRTARIKPTGNGASLALVPRPPDLLSTWRCPEPGPTSAPAG